MTTELQPFQADRVAIGKYLGLNPQDPKSHAVMAVCDRYALDPVLKHVVLIDGNVYISRDGLLHVAHQSGQFDGMEVVEEGEDDNEWWCRVAVYRKDMGRPFKYRGRYSKKNRNAKYGPEMALTRAESLALRRAFDVGGLPIFEEVDQPAPVVSATRLIPEAAPVPQGGDTNQAEVIEDAVIVDDQATADQRMALIGQLRRVGMGTEADGLKVIEEMLGRPVASTGDLSTDEAQTLIDTLSGYPDASPEAIDGEIVEAEA